MKKLNTRIRRMVSAALAIVMALSLSIPAFAAGAGLTPSAGTAQALLTVSSIPFVDVPTTNTFYDSIMWCSGNGIVYGYADGSFKPAGTVSRSNFVVMLSRAFYADEVALYSGEPFNYTGTTPNIMAMVDNRMLNGTSFQYDYAVADIMNADINRYDMAQLMTNIMNANGFAAGSAEKSATISKIADYSSIPSEYRDAVANVYALGIITGFGDGSFGGEGIMTRGQACVVIYRMLQKCGGSSIANPAPEAPDNPPVQPETPSTPETPETPTGATLTNGKAITEANVTELLEQLKAQWPNKTDVGAYAAGNASPVRVATSKYVTANGVLTNTTSGCGGWGARVFDAVFGQDATLRKVAGGYDAARPGDILIQLDAQGHLMHVSVVYQRTTVNGIANAIISTDANVGNSGTNVVWWTLGVLNPDNYNDAWTYDIYTAYPD